MKITKYSQLKDGMVVKYKYCGVQCDRAILRLDRDNDYVATTDGGDRLLYVWDGDSNGRFSGDITDVESLEGLRAAKVGDVVVGKWNGRYRIMAIIGEFMELSDIDGRYDDWYGIEFLEKDGFRLVDQEEPEKSKDPLDRLDTYVSGLMDGADDDSLEILALKKVKNHIDLLKKEKDEK